MNEINNVNFPSNYGYGNNPQSFTKPAWQPGITASQPNYCQSPVINQGGQGANVISQVVQVIEQLLSGILDLLGRLIGGQTQQGQAPSNDFSTQNIYPMGAATPSSQMQVSAGNSSEVAFPDATASASNSGGSKDKNNIWMNLLGKAVDYVGSYFSSSSDNVDSQENQGSFWSNLFGSSKNVE